MRHAWYDRNLWRVTEWGNTEYKEYSDKCNQVSTVVGQVGRF